MRKGKEIGLRKGGREKEKEKEKKKKSKKRQKPETTLSPLLHFD